MTIFRLTGTAAGSGVSAGLAVITATAIAVRTIQSPTADPANPGPAFYLLVLGTLAGLIAAGTVVWTLMAPIGSTYRRGGLALVSAFATIVLMLVTMPIDRLLGRAGLAGFCLVCLGLAALLWRRARHAQISWPGG